MSSATTSPELDELVSRLASRKHDWVQTTIARRLVYLEECLAATWRVSERWVQAACHAKGLGPNSYLAGEEWAMGPMITLRNLRLLIRALRAGGRPPSGPHRRGPRGQGIVEVFPGDFLERLLWMGIHAELWLEPNRASSQGAIYRRGAPAGAAQVALVLGAGNVSSIAPTDVLSKLFTENQVVLLKLNPVNDYLGILWEEAFYPLIRDGYLALCYGGGELGQQACAHAQVETIHITGSRATYEAVAGAVSKPITAELGCVSPVLVVPGPWTPAELAYQARHVAGMLSTNAGFNCTAPQVLLTSREWRHREAFLEQIRHALGALPARKAYYPGAERRHGELLEHYPRAERLSAQLPGCLPWTLITDVREDDFALRNEAFCGVLAEVALPASGSAAFLAQAVAFANERLWGNLSCSLLLHPETQRSEERAVATALEDLRYGAIGLNLWPGMSFALMSVPWGAYPGNTREDIQSGRGWVHNTNLFDHPQKSVLWGPFKTAYVPPWFPGHPRLRQIGRLLTEYELAPSLGKALAVSLEVMRGGLLKPPGEPLRLPTPR